MLGRSDIMAGKAYVTLAMKNSDFIKSLKNASARLKAFGEGMKAIGIATTAAGTAMTGMLGAALGKFAETGEELGMMSKRTGIAADALAEIGYAAKQSGTDLEGFEGGLRKMQKYLEMAAEGTKQNVEGLARLGLTYQQLDGMSPDQQFQKISDAIAGIKDPTRRAGMAMEIFGRSGTALLPMIENLAALRKEIRAGGFVPSEKDIAMAERVHHAFVLIKTAAENVVFNIGAALGPAFTDISQRIMKVMSAVNQWIKNNRGLFVTIATVAGGVLALGTGLIALGFASQLAGAGLGFLARGLTATAGVLASVLSPLGLVLVGLAGASYAWVNFTDSGQAAGKSITKTLLSLGATAKDTFSGIGDAISGGNWAMAGRIAMTGLKVAMLEGVMGIANAIGGTFGDFLGKLTGEISNGDLSAAWSTAIFGMTALWDSFSQGVVTAFVAAAKKIVDVWAAATKWIKDQILGLSSVGGLKLLGIDMEQNEKDAQTREAKELKFLKNRYAHLQRSKPGDEYDSQADIDAEMQRVVKRMRYLTSPHENNLAEAIGYGAPNIDAIAGNLKGGLDSVKTQADANAKAAAAALANRVTGGTATGADALAQAQKDLTNLRAQAAAEAAKAANNLKDKFGPPPDKETGGLKQQVIGTYSGAAAINIARGASANPMVKAVEKQTIIIKQHVTKNEKQMSDLKETLMNGLVLV